MEDIRRRCNPNVDLSKFTFNKKILRLQLILYLNFILIFINLSANIKLKIPFYIYISV